MFVPDNFVKPYQTKTCKNKKYRQIFFETDATSTEMPEKNPSHIHVLYWWPPFYNLVNIAT